MATAMATATATATGWGSVDDDKSGRCALVNLGTQRQSRRILEDDPNRIESSRLR
jgi:hypothetical protein